MPNMENNEVLAQEVKVLIALLENKNKWLPNIEISALVDGVARRTIRAYRLKFVKAGLLDQAEVFPSHKFKWAEKAGKRNIGYLQRLEKAREVFAL
jgi:hypothetical protein